MIMNLRTWVAVMMGHGFGLPSWAASFSWITSPSIWVWSPRWERERERENDFRGERKERESEREKKGTICLRPREREGSVCTQMLNSFLTFDTLDKTWFLVFNMQNVKNLAYLIVVLLQTKSHSYQTL